MMKIRKQRPLTNRQKEILEFMRAFFLENDQIPPIHIIRDAFLFSSENAAASHVMALARKGLIEKNVVGKYRFSRKQKE